MNMLIIPPEVVPVEDPVLFLAGPIQGATDWQAAAASRIAAAGVPCAIASPRRPPPPSGVFAEADYNAQVDWEHRYLDLAAKTGVILFWLAKEAVHDCGRAFAQTSRFELGEAVTLHRLAGARLVIGIEDGFSNARYIRRTVGKKAPAVPILPSLDETCDAAVALLPR
jgi:hypothetical protein